MSPTRASRPSQRWVAVAALAVAFMATACGGADSGAAVHRLLSSAEQEGSVMEVMSAVFAAEAAIPSRYTCDGLDVSPPLTISGVPEGTETLALLMDDPDAPGGVWDHWVAFDIRPRTDIPEAVGPLGVAGANSWGRTSYGGPCPPSGTHRYFITVFAVDTELVLGPGATKSEVLAALEGHVLAQATLMGTYGR